MAASDGLAYRPRIADAELRACLSAAGAVVIEGPKACGKTRLAQQLAASTVLLDVDLAAPPGVGGGSGPGAGGASAAPAG
jgi:hypothetical protein